MCSKESGTRSYAANKIKPLNLFTFIARCSTYLQTSELKYEPKLQAVPTFHMRFIPAQKGTRVEQQTDML
jgi:hypothetical protein